MKTLFVAALTALLVIGYSSVPQVASIKVAAETHTVSNPLDTGTPPRELYDQKPVRVGLYKGSDSDQGPWWCDKEHTLIDWEAEKKVKHIAIDTIVIHHTAGIPGRTWQELSDLQYKLLYIKRFKPSILDPVIPLGVAIQSGHFRQLTDGPNRGKWIEVFYAYTWLVREDGTTERLLNDDEVGWDSRDWGVNMRSVSICFDGDYTDVAPSDVQLKAAAKLIADYQKKYQIRDIVGHRDVTATICPGNWWSNGGKDKLMSFVGK